MLVYASLLPALQHPLAEADIEKKRVCGEMLNMITTNHIRNTIPCFEKLEQEQIIIGNGGFLSVSVFFDQEILYLDLGLDGLDPLIEAARSVIKAPIFFCFTTLGHVNFLLCYPRATAKEENDPSFLAEVKSQFENLYEAVRDFYPGIHFLLSDMMCGEHSVFITSNSLSHAKEYYIFKENVPPVIHIDMQEVLHSGFIDNLNVYRTLSMQISKSLIEPDFDAEKVGQDTVLAITTNCRASMESLHHHTQIFILSLTEYLTGSGIVNSAYIEKHQIVRRIMGFESESELILLVSSLLDELHHHYHMLKVVGKQHQIADVRAYIEKHISDPDLTLQKIADLFDMNPSQLTKQFRSYLGITLYQFLKMERVHFAQHLLQKDPNLTIQEVAKQSGYSDITTMYRAFKSVDGITPGYFQKASGVTES